MEPRAGAPQALTDDAAGVPASESTGGRARMRVRTLAACLLLVGIAFTQSPGYLVADTKFDLSADPQGFLARALHLWDPSGALGQLQNQAYGYLWPMGPFFTLGQLLDVPGWAVQRGWMALLLCVAFTGTVRVVRELDVRSDLAALAAGAAYALSPRILSTIGTISIESWPSALAPWVLLPLVVGADRGSPRRAALLAGGAVGMIGGVNAAATAAVLPIGAVWLLTRRRGPRRTSLMVWWPVFTVLGTLWWLLPLFVLGSYSPPFLDFIESASITTFPTTVFDALRGTSDWVPYVDPSWTGGGTVLSEGYLALNSGLVLGAGLAGMALRSNPHRLFLLLTLLTGLLLVTAGHTGSVHGWAAGSLQDLLDGALAPLRNVHKFDPVVRLPLVVGLAFLLDAVLDRRAAPSLKRQPLVAGMVVVGVIGSTVPALTGGLAAAGGVLETPTYWHQTISWLDQRSTQGAALLAPGSGFGDYRWGAPRDEPVQYLGAQHWAVRNAIPLTPPGSIRALDAVEDRFAQGRPSAGLAGYLGRLGVKYVVVRNDLAPGSDVPDPVLVRQAVAGSAGLGLVRSFGPEVGGEPSLSRDGERLVVNGGWQEQRRAIEVYEVAGTTPAVVASRLPVVVGAPEDLLDLDDLGVLDGSPTRLAVDLGREEVPREPVVLTDGLAHRERFFGRVHDGSSAVLTPGDVPRSGNPVRSYTLPQEDRWSTRARLDGVASVAASSSMSDSTAAGGSRRGELPFAALDAAPGTAWVSAVGESGRAWWQLGLTEPTAVRAVRLTLALPSRDRTEVVVVTDAGRTRPVELRVGEPVEVALDGAETRTLRVEGTRDDLQLALADVDVPGVTAERRLVLPEVPESWGAPGTVVLRRDGDARTGCVVVDGRVPCVADRAVGAEEPGPVLRDVPLPQAEQYGSVITASPVPGPDLDRLLLQDRLLSVVGSSTGPADPRASGLAAVDGDPATAWTPDVDDLSPQLALDWLGDREVTGLRLVVADGAPVQRPLGAELSWPGGSQDLVFDERGRAELDEPVVTSSLTLRLTTTDGALSLNAEGVPERLPPGISELRVRGMPFEPIVPSTEVRTRPCGTGPTLVVNGQARTTRLVASDAQLFGMQQVRATPCGVSTVQLERGTNRVDLDASSVAAADSLVLRASGSPAPAAGAVAVPLSRPDQVSLDVPPGAEPGTLVVRQNTNAGWAARSDGEQLAPVVVDGWQQAWTWSGASGVEARFGPDRTYRAALAAGAAGFLLLLSLIALRGRCWPGADLAPVGPIAAGPVATAATALVAGGLLAGWPGVAVLAVAVLIGWLLRPRAPEAGAWVVGALVFVAATTYAVRPWGDAAGWAGNWPLPHYLVVAAVGVVVACVTSDAGPPGSPGTTPATTSSTLRASSLRPSRIAGRSTKR